MWRGVSIRKLLLLIVGPMLVETLNMLVLAWMLLRTVTLGYEPNRQMWIAVLGAGGYAVSSFVSGRWVTRRVAPWLMAGTIVAAMGAGLVAVAVGTYPVFLAVAAVMGVCIGHYYVPFQINMVHVRPFHTVAWSVAFYNVAWGTGAAVGPFLGAWFEKRPAMVVGGIAVGLAAAHTAINLLAMTAPRRAQADVSPVAAFASTAAQRLGARIAFFAVGTVIRALYATLWPYVCTVHGWTDAQKAWGLFAMFINVPVWAMVLARLRRRLRGPGCMVAAMLVGGASFACVPLAGDWGWAMVCAAGVGMMEGVVVFHALYYANTDPATQSRSVGWIESLAGAAFVSGPLFGGLLAGTAEGALTARPYLAGAALIAVALAVVVVMHRRSAARPAVPPADQPR